MARVKLRGQLVTGHIFSTVTCITRRLGHLTLYTLRKGGLLQDAQPSACVLCSTISEIHPLVVLEAQQGSFRSSQIHWLLLSAASETALLSPMVEDATNPLHPISTVPAMLLRFAARSA